MTAASPQVSSPEKTISMHAPFLAHTPAPQPILSATQESLPAWAWPEQEHTVPLQVLLWPGAQGLTVSG